MGQLFDRILKFGKTYVSDKFSDNELNTANKFINSDDDELKRIIEELNNPQKSSSGQTNSGQTNSGQNSKYNRERQNTERQNTASNSNFSFILPNEVKLALKDLSLSETKFSKRKLNNEEIESIKKQYKSLVRQFHPDKYQSGNSEKRKDMELKTSKLNNAYGILKKYYQFN